MRERGAVRKGRLGGLCACMPPSIGDYWGWGVCFLRAESAASFWGMIKGGVDAVGDFFGDALEDGGVF